MNVISFPKVEKMAGSYDTVWKFLEIIEDWSFYYVIWSTIFMEM